MSMKGCRLPFCQFFYLKMAYFMYASFIVFDGMNHSLTACVLRDRIRALESMSLFLLA
jgi:hypothetical protein